MKQLFQGYHEFPTMVHTNCSGSRRYKDDEAKAPLLDSEIDVKENLFKKVPLEILKEHTYIFYVKLNNH